MCRRRFYWTKRCGTLHVVLSLLWSCDLLSSSPPGGSVTLPAQAAVQRKMVCPPPCLAQPVSEPPLSPLPRWTPRPSSKLCSSPPHSPPPPPSPPAHRPLPSASRYSSCLVWKHRLFINILLHSQCSNTNCGFHLDSRQPKFSHMKLIFTHLIYLTSLNGKFMDTKNLVCSFVVSEWRPFDPEMDQWKEVCLLF